MLAESGFYFTKSMALLYGYTAGYATHMPPTPGQIHSS